ncbi:MAG TPA: hypothetical protein PKD83_12290 [Ignavibacteria bacterium]|nr:hypothetical protein [Ignavibacteria bacterium]
MIIRNFIFFLFFLILTNSAFSQQESSNYKTFIAKIGNGDTLVNLNDKFLIQYSDILTLQNKVLSPLNDYNLDYRNGILTINKDLFKKYELDTFQIYNLKIDYDVFPYILQDEYSNFNIVLEKDTVTGDTVQIATQKKDFIGSIFEGTDLEKSGSLFRGVTVGSNQDLVLNSGFRLQLNGKLSSDFEINAALTDENSPIQPEGNTEKLQELDKVFIELKNKNFIGTIGDINVDFSRAEFLTFKRKIQGAKAFSDYGIGNVFLSGAVQSGKFNTNAFNGQDNIQGPYYLIGRDNEINILVLSGTETVYLDGVPLTRGEQADYTIDYGVGAITFTNRILITSNSRLIVDFEYSDKKYSSTIFSGANQLRLFNNKMTLGVSFVGLNDNEDKTIDFTLSEEDKEILANAGDNKNKAVKSGVIYVGKDSAGIGLGLYVKADTLFNNQQINYYKYLPGDSNAVYQVVFSFVGQGTGSYVQQSSFQYNFAGPGLGIYDTVIFIPAPGSHQVADININYESSPKREFTFNIESAVSFLDANKFSTIDDQNNNGGAFLGTIGINKNNFKLFGLKLRSLNFNIREKISNKVFIPLERYNPVEFYRQYDIQDTSKQTEELREANLSVSPSEFVTVNALFGQLKRADYFNALKTSAEINLKKNTNGFPEVQYLIDIINTDNSLINAKSRWLRQFANAGFRKFFGDVEIDNTNLEIKLGFTQENRQNKFNVSGNDSLLTGSFSYYEILPRVVLNNFNYLNLFGGLGYRNDNSPVGGEMVNESKSFTQIYGISYSGISWLSTTFDLTLRDKKFSEEFVSETNQDNKTLLVNFQTRVDPLSSALQTDLYYNITSERQSKKEKVFIPVRAGEGNYIYLGDLNGNGLQDENEFQLTTYNDGTYIRIFRESTSLFPVTGLNTSVRFILRPSRYFLVSGNGFLPELMRNTTAETYLRAEETSKDQNTNNIYFLNFSTFQNDSNTLFGSQLFQQDIDFFEFNPLYSLKLRYIEQEIFNQFVSGNERFFSIQKFVKLKLGLTKDLTTFFEFQNRTDRNSATENSVRNRNILFNGLTADFSYRPIQDIESGFQLIFSKANDTYTAIPTSADINQQTFRFTYSFTQQGRVRFELQRDEVILSNLNVSFPYELTNGKTAGKTFFWRGFLDYSISNNIQATLNYDGRVEENRKVINTGRAEIKAFF